MYTYIKMVNKYYQKINEKLRKWARERYKNLSEEEKEKRQKKAWERRKNLSEEGKERESVSIIMIEIKIFLKKKNKRKLSIWEIII